MKLAMSGQVLSAEPTRGGKAQRVIVADGQERNAVVIAPNGVVIGKQLEAFPVRAQVQTLKDGTPTNAVVYMASEGWPERERN